jgi:hypothetical protein
MKAFRAFLSVPFYTLSFFLIACSMVLTCIALVVRGDMK